MGDIDMVETTSEAIAFQGWWQELPSWERRVVSPVQSYGETTADSTLGRLDSSTNMYMYMYIVYIHIVHIYMTSLIYIIIYIYIYKYIFDHCSCEETTSQGQIGLKNQAGGSLPTDVLVSLRPISSNGKCSAQCSFPPNSTSWDLRDVWPNFKLAGGLQQKAGFRCLPLPCGVHPIPQRPLTNARTLRTSVCCCTEVGKARHGWH